MDKFLFWGRGQSLECCWSSFHFWGTLIKLPIFVTQRAAAPKNGVEFRQKFIRAFRCSLATSYDDLRRHATSMKLTGTDRRTGRQTYVLGGCASKILTEKLVIMLSRTNTHSPYQKATWFLPEKVLTIFTRETTIMLEINLTYYKNYQRVHKRNTL